MNLLQSVRTYTSAFFVPTDKLDARQKWVLGLVNLASVVVFWVGSSFLVNDLVEDGKYTKPFFITYLNTSCFCFYLIPYLRYEGMTVSQFIDRLTGSFDEARKLSKVGVQSYGSNDDLENLSLRGSSPMGDGTAPRNESSFSLELDPSEEIHVIEATEESLHISIYETVLLSLKFIVLWFSANLVTNMSLGYTTVASQTILSSTSSFFTLLVGYAYSVERISRNKIMGIVLSFAGVFIVTKVDTVKVPDQNPSHSFVHVLEGNMLALSGAFIYGVYTILLKFKITIPGSTRERELNTHLFFGFVGVWCLLFLWPVMVVLHLTGVEVFELPRTSEVAVPLLVNAIVTFVSDFCWCKAVLLTSPLTVTVGLSMTIPLAMVGDWVLKGFDVNGWYLFGASIVTVGFFIINRDEKGDFIEPRSDEPER